MDLHPDANLTTRRLLLRPLAMAHRDALAEAMGRYDVARWLIAKPYPFGGHEAQTMIKAAVPGQSWLAWDGARLVGGTTVENGLGFWVARPMWGQGFATEIAQAAVTAFMRQTPNDPLLAGAMTANTASIHVLEKLGFERLGPDTAWSEALNQIVDVSIYRLKQVTQRLS